MRIKNLNHASLLLQAYVPRVAQLTGDDMSLERMWPLLKLVGDPHQQLRAIHIAGTSGKTSTAYYCADMLLRSGKSVGLTVSPHIDSVTERVQINGCPLSEDKFCSMLGEFLDVVSKSYIEPSYFELLLVFALWVFAQEKVDYAVLETGMGGLFDWTNVVTREDKVCIITDIGFDHMHILGNTLEAIAAQKAGIIHEHNQVFMYDQGENINKAIDARVQEKDAQLVRLDYEKLLQSSSAYGLAHLPLFQKRNWLIAQQACRHVAQRDDFSLIDTYDISQVSVPGRMEQRMLPDGTMLIMDGAHNQQKMQAFVESFKASYPGEKAAVLLAMKEGKEYDEVMYLLAEITEQMIITSFQTSQDLPVKSLDITVLEASARKYNTVSILEPDHSKALALLTQNNSKLKVITGSFYLLGQIRQWL